MVGCTGNTDARDNTATTYTTADKGVRIYWLSGAKVADNYEDFYDGSWDDEFNDKNEYGTNGPDTSHASNWPFTGCEHDGTEDTFGSSSRGLGPNDTRVGRPNFSGSQYGPLSSIYSAQRNATRPMYGLSEVFEVDNAAPTASNATVATKEDVEYALRAADFNFMDVDSADTLSSIKITTLPVTGFGTLSFDGAVLGSSDLPKTVTSTELGANKLVFTPVSCQDEYATFMFKVNDGRADSASAYTMTVVPAFNYAPVLAEPIPNQYARVGEAFTYTVAQETFSDPDDCGDVLAYRALWDARPEWPYGAALPQWLHFDRATVSFSGTPAASDVDSLSVKVEASDGEAAVRDVFYLEVQPAARAMAPLVSNLDQGWRVGSRTRGARLRQRFTTGPNAGGYTLGSIDVGRHEGVARNIWTDDAKVRLSVCPVAPATGSCTALTPPSRTTRWADTMRFTVQGTMMLAPSTTYDLVVSGSEGQSWIGATQVGSLDADALPGWRLAARANRTTVRVALHGSANNPAAMPNSADADIVVTQGSPHAFAASDFPFTASSGGGTFWGVEVTSVPEKERSSTTQFKRGRLTFDGGDIYAPFTITKAALDAGRLVYSAPADDAVGEDYDWFRFRVRDAGHASMASYRMSIDVVASSQQQGAEPAVIDGTPSVSGAGGDAQWSEGETVGVTVTFSEAVDVDTSGGTPSIGIGLGGTAARSATYASGTGTTELVFEYTLVSGDGSHSSMAVTPNSLALNGGTIRSADGVDAVLTHNGTVALGTTSRSTEAETVFQSMPRSHDGTAFTFEVRFSGTPTGLSANRDAASIFEATGGTVTGAQVTTKGGQPVWEVTVTPNGVGDVKVRLPARACSEAYAVCINGRRLAEALEAVVSGTPITAQFTQAPAAHDGSSTFLLHLEFSHKPKKFSYRTVLDGLFEVAGGRIEKARRLEKGRNLRWEMTVVPEGDGAVMLTAHATTDCAASHAACDAEGRKFAGGLELTVPGPATPPSVSVSAPGANAGDRGHGGGVHALAHRGDGRCAHGVGLGLGLGDRQCARRHAADIRHLPGGLGHRDAERRDRGRRDGRGRKHGDRDGVRGRWLRGGRSVGISRGGRRGQRRGTGAVECVGGRLGADAHLRRGA